MWDLGWLRFCCNQLGAPNGLKRHPEATDMWRKPHCTKVAVRRDSQWRSAEYKANIVLRGKNPCFLAVWSRDQGGFFYEESHFQTGKGCQWYEKLLWCITGAPQTWAEKATTGRMFLSAHCDLRENKQVSRSVGCSRKTDYCTGICQGFQPWDVGYLFRGHALGTCVQELWNEHRPDLEKNPQSKEVERVISGCEHQGHDSSSVLCPTLQILAQLHNCFFFIFFLA